MEFSRRFNGSLFINLVTVVMTGLFTLRRSNYSIFIAILMLTNLRIMKSLFTLVNELSILLKESWLG